MFTPFFLSCFSEATLVSGATNFLTADPFSLRFPYIFRLINFSFDTEYYAILISNSFTLIHFRTLARPLQFLLFAFHSKQINIMIYFYFYVFENNDSNPSFHEEQLPAMENDLSFLVTSFQTWSHEEQHGSKYPVVKILSSNKTNYCPYAPAFLGMIWGNSEKLNDAITSRTVMLNIEKTLSV